MLQVLDHRLVSRVDTMLEQGLVQELINFHQLYNKDRLSTGTPHDYTTGIFQSIGFKEFHDFLMLDEEERESPEGKRLFQRGLEEMKLATRRYARKQLKWIRNRFLRRPNRPVPNVYGLDGTDPSQWDEKVLNRALSIVDSYMKGETPSSIEPLSLESSLNNANNSEFCTVCRRVFIGRLQLEAHLNSKKHQKMERRVALSAPEQGKLPGESGSMKEVKEEIKKENVEQKPQENVSTNTIKEQTT
uniref:C2H2-type domain-containing protein n=1 Tax=Timema genevievae TaxID=629358 RepID=A0A7R9PNU7_TIMGE|nr:unnamed protein product [Timema genevievae]